MNTESIQTPNIDRDAPGPRRKRGPRRRPVVGLTLAPETIAVLDSHAEDSRIRTRSAAADDLVRIALSFLAARRRIGLDDDVDRAIDDDAAAAVPPGERSRPKAGLTLSPKTIASLDAYIEHNPRIRIRSGALDDLAKIARHVLITR